MGTSQQQKPGERVRTIMWADPQVFFQAAESMSGIEGLRAAQEGVLPPAPFAQLLGMNLVEVDEGRVVFTLEPGEYHYSPLGTVQGGVIATLMDAAMGCAVHSLLPKGTSYTTLEIKVNYLRALTVVGGLVSCEGKVIHRGGRIAAAEARVSDQSGRLSAYGSTTCLILHL